MGIRIDRLQAAILEATATEALAKATITALREVLDTEARRRFKAEGAAPTWKSALGAIRFDAPGEWSAEVADPARFGSYVAERHPGEATAAIHVNAADLEDALTALGFVNVDVLEARVDVRTAFRDKYLEGLLVDVEETAGEDGTVDRVVTIVDPATGELVDGVSATRTNAGGKLVVTLDRKAKAAALEAAKGAASAAIAAATGEPPAAVEEATTTVQGGRIVTLDEAIASGHVRPASELSAPERATVERFEEAPDALAEDGHRLPYVGEGADGARRSAEIDRTEAEGLDPFADAERYADVMRSAERWDAQARELAGDEGIADWVDSQHGDAPEPPDVVEDTEPAPEDSDGCLGAYINPDENTPQGAAFRLAEENNRETLRRICRAKGIPAGGGKLDLAARIVEAGGV